VSSARETSSVERRLDALDANGARWESVAAIFSSSPSFVVRLFWDDLSRWCCLCLRECLWDRLWREDEDWARLDCVVTVMMAIVWCLRRVVPRASPKSGEHSEFRVTTAHAEPLRKPTHFLHQYTSPFTMLPSVLFYKEGLYISTQHSSKHWRGSPFTGSPHHHLVRVGVNTSILILIVSILPFFLQASLIAYAIRQFELK
jgi:hypothetical protein